jgi:hypothetical protein
MPEINAFTLFIALRTSSTDITLVFGLLPKRHSLKQVSQFKHFMESQLILLPFLLNAPAGHTFMHSPQPLHMFIVSGLWQYKQLKLHPWKNITVRFPGPSTELNGNILFITASVIISNLSFQNPGVLNCPKA